MSIHLAISNGPAVVFHHRIIEKEVPPSLRVPTMVFVTDVPIFAPITIGIAYSAVSCFVCSKGGKKITKDGMESFQMGNLWFKKEGSWSARRRVTSFASSLALRLISLTSHGHESRNKTMVERYMTTHFGIAWSMPAIKAKSEIHQHDQKYRRYQHHATVCVDDKQFSDNVELFRHLRNFC